jgi:ubiquinone/menaquinone biosynthesis C-methylase UbiE
MHRLHDMSSSVSFDRAAEFYDETRADPPHVANALTEALLAELEKARVDRLLEVGIGTGRIARPLAERGIRVTGFDIAPRMVAKLREQLTPQHIEPDISFGDATALPLRDASFKAALGVHILHLVSSLESAVAEIRRVLAPGGLYLSPYLRFEEERWRRGFNKWDELVAKAKYTPRHRPREAEINAALSQALGEPTVTVYATDIDRTTPREHLQRFRDRVDAWSWGYPDDVFAELLAEFEAWYPTQYPELDEPFGSKMEYTLTTFRK